MLARLLLLETGSGPVDALEGLANPWLINRLGIMMTLRVMRRTANDDSSSSYEKACQQQQHATADLFLGKKEREH